MMHRVIGNYELRALLAAAAAAALSIVALCFTVIVRANQTEAFRQQVAFNCQTIESLKMDIRDTLRTSRARIVARTDIDPAVKRASLAATDAEIARYAPDDCPTP